MTDHLIDRAVVLGGSVGGLLAARVLADFCAEVVVVDRDDLLGVTGARRGVPQGRHTHGVLARGQQILEELFPGFTAELTAAGVRSGDLGSQLRWYFNGRRLRPVETGLIVVGGDRPVLEHHVRLRIAALPNVRFRTGHDAISLVTAPGAGRVTGVRLTRYRGDGTETVLDADLVVDATGRGSRLPAWLRDLGYPEVPEEKVTIGLAYTTGHFLLRSDVFGTDVSVNPVATPAHPRGAFLTSLGGKHAILSLTGVLGDHAPTDHESFVAYARTLPVPDVYEAVHDAEPLDELTTYRYPASVRRRYERLPRFPDRLLVLGDAVCTFNPAYGQGITVAALEALTLREHLRRGTVPSATAYFTDIAKDVDPAWAIAAGGDLAFDRAQGRRTVSVRLGNAFLPRIHAAATLDESVTAAFIRVAGLVDRPESLMGARFAWKVLRTARRARAGFAPMPVGR